MRVLALYDIHGNIDALDAVLADPQAADPDIVVVGGDAVPGPSLVGCTELSLCMESKPQPQPRRRRHP